MNPLLLIPVLAFLLALAVTPLVEWLALRNGLVDAPDERRKLHGGTVALGGGVGVLVAVCGSIALGTTFSTFLRAAFAAHALELGAFGVAVCLMCLVGFVDDTWTLRGRQKLVGQVAAILVIVLSGLVVQRVNLLGWEVELGLLAIPFTLLWLVGAVNAVNLLDGADGLATSVGIVTSVALAFMAWLTNSVGEAIVAGALAGGLLGFLVYNRPPARIFLGDAGSLLIGLTLGVLAIRASLKGPATMAIATPLALLTVPILDSTAAVLRRRLTGRSIYTSDRSHLHHVLMQRGFGPFGLLAFVSLLCLTTAGGAFLGLTLGNDWIPLVASAVVVGALVGTRLFGFTECHLLCGRVLAFITSVFSRRSRRPEFRERRMRLQGTHDWSGLWLALIGRARDHELVRLRLDVSLPWLHEEFNATWECPRETPDVRPWTAVVPLVDGRRTLGRLEVTGLVDESGDGLGRMARLLAEFDPLLRDVVAVAGREVGTNGGAVAANQPKLEREVAHSDGRPHPSPPGSDRLAPVGEETR